MTVALATSLRRLLPGTSAGATTIFSAAIFRLVLTPTSLRTASMACSGVLCPATTFRCFVTVIPSRDTKGADEMFVPPFTYARDLAQFVRTTNSSVLLPVAQEALRNRVIKAFRRLQLFQGRTIDVRLPTAGMLGT